MIAVGEKITKRDYSIRCIVLIRQRPYSDGARFGGRSWVTAAARHLILAVTFDPHDCPLPQTRTFEAGRSTAFGLAVVGRCLHHTLGGETQARIVLLA
jgi:hypothetical protein